MGNPILWRHSILCGSAQNLMDLLIVTSVLPCDTMFSIITQACPVLVSLNPISMGLFLASDLFLVLPVLVL